jgi:hypothetical protein
MRPVALPEVVDCGQLDCPRPEARLLEDLSHHRIGRRIVHVGPSARQRPEAVAHFPDQEHAAIDERGRAYVDFGRRVSHVVAYIVEKTRVDAAGALADHGRRELLDALVALPIEGITAEGEANLCDGAKLAADGEPCRFVIHAVSIHDLSGAAAAQLESINNSAARSVPASSAKPGPPGNCRPASSKV